MREYPYLVLMVITLAIIYLLAKKKGADKSNDETENL